MTAPALELELVRLAVERIEAMTSREDIPHVESALRLGQSQPPTVPAVVLAVLAYDYDEGAAQHIGTYQRASTTLGVWHVLDSRNTPRGAGGSSLDPLARLAGMTRDVLQAWLPDQSILPAGVRRQSIDPLRLRRGRLVEMAQGRAVWLDEYTFTWRPAGREVQR